MQTKCSGNKLKAYKVAVEAAGITLSLAKKVPAPLKPLADQAIRAASSVPANLSEGQGRTGRAQINHFRIAYGSAMEIDAHLRLLATAGAIDSTHAQQALDLFDRVRAMTWKLIHRKE